jgi:hypothetical protein
MEADRMNRRKNRNTAVESEMVSGGILTVDLDIGYGVTKVMTDQTAEVIQPTWMGNQKGKIACWKRGKLRSHLSELAAPRPGCMDKAGLLEV